MKIVEYDSLLQSPTLSSSTHQSSSFSSINQAVHLTGVLMSRAYVPNCDNLATLLGTNMDESLMARGPGFNLYNPATGTVKHEPFDGAGYPEHFLPHQPLPDYGSFCAPPTSYATMLPMTSAPLSASSSGEALSMN